MVHRVAAIVSLGLVCAASSDANAFECTRSDRFCLVSVHWTTRTIPYVVRRSGSSSFDETQASSTTMLAMARWSNVACSDISFAPSGVLDMTTPASTDNEVVFVATDWDVDNDPDAAGVTRVAYNTASGEVQHAVLELNEQVTEIVDPTSCTSGFDLETVLTHEIGHYLGLAHPCEYPFTGGDSVCPVIDCRDIEGQYNEEEPFPTMWPLVQPCDTQLRSLEGDDTAALCYVYPAAAPARQCYQIPDDNPAPIVGSTAFGCTSTRGPPSFGWLIGLAVAVWLKRKS